jgi:hypothetical protein
MTTRLVIYGNIKTNREAIQRRHTKRSQILKIFEKQKKINFSEGRQNFLRSRFFNLSGHDFYFKKKGTTFLPSESTKTVDKNPDKRLIWHKVSVVVGTLHISLLLLQISKTTYQSVVRSDIFLSSEA